MFSLGGLRKAGPSLEHRLIPKVSPISDGQMKTSGGRFRAVVARKRIGRAPEGAREADIAEIYRRMFALSFS